MQQTEAKVLTKPPFDEVGEFFATIVATPPTRATACRGWTAHELVAHLAAGAEEETGVIEAHLAGTPRGTRPFEDREAPFRALPDDELRDRLLEESGRHTNALRRLEDQNNQAVRFTGRAMTAEDFAMHSRSECALHRWDLVGRDDIGWAMLSQPRLTEHALTVLNSMSALPEAPRNRYAPLVDRKRAQIGLRSAGHADVVVTVGDGDVSMELVPAGTGPIAVELDAAARLLLLWGRREPSAPIDVRASGAARRIVEVLLGW